MRKFLVSTLGALTIGAAMMGNVFASSPVTESDLTIGGIELGMSLNYVETVYGAPTSFSSTYSIARNSYDGQATYGSNLSINTSGPNNSVEGVTTTGNTGLATPRGIRVGSTRDQVLEAYGYPDRPYSTNTLYFYAPLTASYKYLKFEFNNDDKVVKISTIVQD